MTPWPAGVSRRASINSFGYGGANAHCILDHVSCVLPDDSHSRQTLDSPSYANAAGKPQHSGDSLIDYSPQVLTRLPDSALSRPRDREPLARSTTETANPTKPKEAVSSTELLFPDSTTTNSKSSCAPLRRLTLLPFSAHDDTSLRRNIVAASEAAPKYSARDLAYTLAARRSQFSHRGFFIAQSHNYLPIIDVEKCSFGQCGSQKVRVGFVFTGKSSVWEIARRSSFTTFNG